MVPGSETITTLSNEVSQKETSRLGRVIEFVGGLTWSVIWVYGSLKITVIWV
jgi:hypothetical protein